MSLAVAMCMFGGIAFADSAKSISINFCGSRDVNMNPPTDVDLSGMGGDALYGALPVAGKNWNNFQTHWSGFESSIARSTAIKLCDGTTAQGVTVEYDSAYIYTITTDSAPNNLFHSFIAYDHTAPQSLFLEVSGLTAENGFPETCTVYIYASTDRTATNIKFCPKTVNGITYTFKNGAVAAGSNAWGSGQFALGNKLVEGGDYLKIENVPIVDGKVRIQHAAAAESATDSTYHGSIAAVQLDFGGTSDYALSVNFSGGQNKNDKDYSPLSGETLYGAVPVAGDFWNNTCARVSENQTEFVWNDGAAHPGGVSFSHTSDHTWAIGGDVTSGNLFYGYLDDYLHSFTISGLTAANGFPGCCWVYLYLSTDTANRTLEPVIVNDVTYTYSAGVVQEGVAAWGSSNNALNNTLVHGGDYLKIGPVSLVETEGRLDVRVKDLGNKNKYRGGIAAVQVAFSTPTEFSVAASCEEGLGTVQAGNSAAGATSIVQGTFGTPVVATLTATPAEGYIFGQWEGPMGLVTSGTSKDSTISVKTEMPAAFKAVFVADNTAWTATWTGGGAAGDISDPDNWSCESRTGVRLEGAVPTEDTTVIVSGSTVFSCPQGATLVCKAYDFRNVQLADDIDWSGLDLSKPAVAGSTVNLAGHTLKLSGTGNTAAESFTITDTSTQGGSLLVTVAANEELDNKGIAIAGTVRLVKDGDGTFGAYKSGQTYTGGTHVKKGLLRMHTPQQPLGPGDKTQTIRIEKDAVFDFNGNINGNIYNYELGGTIRVRGADQNAAWNSTFSNTWMQDIVLIDDATIEGGWIYFGSNDANDYGELNLNGKTLTVNINLGNSNDCQCYVRYLRAANGTIKINAVITGALQVVADETDFSAANLLFEGNTFIFLSSTKAGAVPVADFAYARNYWGAHKLSGAQRQVVVGGVYKAGAYRPPLELKNGATLDLSNVAGSWNSTGHSGSISKDNTYVNLAGQVTFAAGATIKVDLRGRKLGQGKTKVVDWAAEPSGVTFVRGVADQKDISFKVQSDGLYARRPVGITILVR